MAVRRTIFFLCDRDSMLGMKLRFTIRDLCWLVLVMAIAAGWWIQQRRMSDQLSVLESRLNIAQQTIQQLDSVID